LDIRLVRMLKLSDIWTECDLVTLETRTSLADVMCPVDRPVPCEWHWTMRHAISVNFNACRCYAFGMCRSAECPPRSIYNTRKIGELFQQGVCKRYCDMSLIHFSDVSDSEFIIYVRKSEWTVIIV
jgi:hypothetical protein